ADVVGAEAALGERGGEGRLAQAPMDGAQGIEERELGPGRAPARDRLTGERGGDLEAPEEAARVAHGRLLAPPVVEEVGRELLPAGLLVPHAAAPVEQAPDPGLIEAVGGEGRQRRAVVREGGGHSALAGVRGDGAPAAPQGRPHDEAALRYGDAV